MAGHWFRLSSPIVLDVTGRDAARYLHARLSNDIRALGVEQSCNAAALTAQGRTEAYLTVLRLGPERFICYGRAPERSVALAAIKRFIVADRVTIQDISDTAAVIHFQTMREALRAISGDSATASSVVRVGEGAYVIAQPRVGDSGGDLLLLNPASFALTPLLDPALELSASSADLLRVKAGIPSFPEELNPDNLFLEAGLLGALSFNKGCYVGQEVNERVDSRGRLPRSLVVLKFDGDRERLESPEIFVEGNQSPQGTVATGAFDGELRCLWALAFVRSDSAEVGRSFNCSGVRAVVQKVCR